MSNVFLEQGIEGVLRDIVELDPDWLSVYLELFRRARTDAAFRRKVDETQRDRAVEANRAHIADLQGAGELRGDLEPKDVGVVLGLVLDGLALRRAAGDELPPVELVLSLLEDAIGGRAPTGRPGRRRA